MPVTLDREAILEAYKDVRNDKSDTMWAVFKYNADNVIIHESSGEEYEVFTTKFTDDERVFGFARLTTGDELSKRAKFVLYSWSGTAVSAMKRAQMGASDKTNIKKLLQSFAMEINTDEHEEIEQEYVLKELRKTGGANYGTGI